MSRSTFGPRTPSPDLDGRNDEKPSDNVPWASQVDTFPFELGSVAKTPWDYGNREEISPYDIETAESYCYPGPLSISRLPAYSPVGTTLFESFRETSISHNTGSRENYLHTFGEFFNAPAKASLITRSWTENSYAPVEDAVTRRALDSIPVAPSRRRSLGRSGALSPDLHDCKDCGKIYTTRGRLKSHQRYHMPREDRPFKCQRCQHPSANFHFWKDLKRHLSAVHAMGGQHFCDRCGKAFRRLDHLRRHEYNHACWKAANSNSGSISKVTRGSSPPSRRTTVKIEHDIPGSQRPHGQHITAIANHTPANCSTQSASSGVDSNGDSPMTNSSFDEAHQRPQDSTVDPIENRDAGTSANERETGSLSGILELRKKQLRCLETKLNQLMTSISNLRLDADSGVDEGVGYEFCSDSDSPWSSVDAEEACEDAMSFSSDDDSWILPVSSHKAGGSGQPEDVSSGSSTSMSRGSTISGRNHNKPGGKRKQSGSDHNGDDGEESKGNDASTGPEAPASNQAPKTAIPCFVEGCKGKDCYASGLVRSAHIHHSFLYCRRCCLLIEGAEEYKRHRITEGEICNHHCISSTCQLKTEIDRMGAHYMPSGRRHLRRTGCPPIQKVAVENLWQYMYHLKYPGRALPKLILESGPSRPHGHSLPRPHRKKLSQDSRLELAEKQTAAKAQDLRLETVEEQVVKAQAAIEAMNQTLATETDLRKQIQRLENIIRTIVRTCNVPDFVQEQINTEAPHVNHAPTTIDPSDILSSDALGSSWDFMDQDLDEYIRDFG